MKYLSLYQLVLASTVLALGFDLLKSQSAQAVSFFTDFAAFDAITTTTLVEDFEAFSPKDRPLSSFVSNGNTYTGISSGRRSPNVAVGSPGYRNFGVPVTNSSVLAANGDENFKIDFGTPAEAVGFDTYLNAYGPATVQVFGTNGLLDTFILQHDPTTVGFLGMASSDLITSIQWTTVRGGVVNTGIDNIRLGEIDSSTIPEPTSLLSLLVLGVLGGGSFLKRRSQE
ncbi:MAG: PEP-CTERM sorting domain-containing protein [Cyanobacteria bacterium SBLK]|nr:PEP-CTERM sorting domain-containing protein [Cyanobacteria bacterium SBLK]